MAKRVLVPKTRNDGTMTEAAFRGWIRSSLRRMSQRWRPIYGVLNETRRAATAGDRYEFGNRIRWTYKCAECGDFYPKKEVEVDHLIPCGSITNIEKDLGPFVLRLLCERDGLRVLCKPCHQVITQSEK